MTELGVRGSWLGCLDVQRRDSSSSSEESFDDHLADVTGRSSYHYMCALSSRERSMTKPVRRLFGSLQTYVGNHTTTCPFR